MKIINTRTHAVLDYIVGLLLIIAPWLFDFARGGPETWLPIVVGASVILYSLFTNYELSLARYLSMLGHIILDVVAGLFLIASPWLFGFADLVVWPHVIIGVIDVAVALLTKTVADFERVT